MNRQLAHRTILREVDDAFRWWTNTKRQVRLQTLQHETVAVRQRLRVDPLKVRLMVVLQIRNYPLTGPVANHEVYGPYLPAWVQPVVSEQNVVAVDRVLPRILLCGTGVKPKDFLVRLCLLFFPLILLVSTITLSWFRALVRTCWQSTTRTTPVLSPARGE